VTTPSPEFRMNKIGDSLVLTSTQGESAVRTDRELLWVLARLGCLRSIFNEPEIFKKSFAQSIRRELQQSLSLGSSVRGLTLWWGYSSFLKAIKLQTPQSVHGVLLGEIVLNQVKFESLFAENADWSTLEQQAYERFFCFLKQLFGQKDIAQELSHIYRAERDACIKEIFIKVMPSIALMFSTLLAIVMAVIVWRSLNGGH